MSSSNVAVAFNYFLGKAINPKQTEPHSDSVIKLCEMIDQGSIDPENAIDEITIQIFHEDPNRKLLAILVLEIVFYKCGSLAHKIICTSSYMDLLKDIIKTTEHKKIRDKILELIKDWADKFSGFPQYCAPEKLLEKLQKEGYYISFQNKNTCMSDVLSSASIISECNKDSEFVPDTDFKDILNEKKQKQFELEFQICQQKRKLEHEKYLKSQKIPVSFDKDVNGWSSSLNYHGNKKASEEKTAIKDEKLLQVAELKQTKNRNQQVQVQSRNVNFPNKEDLSAILRLNDNEDLLKCSMNNLNLEDKDENEGKKCCICLNEKDLLKKFEPCNHRCICASCLDSYFCKICPLCKKIYYKTV